MDTLEERGRERKQIEETIRAQRPDYWIDVPVPPAKPGEAQILSRQIYIGPTTADLKRFG